MSAKVQALIWEHYDPQRFGAPLVMALALGDEADDRGGGISQSVRALAKKTRQGDRAVQTQMRRLESSGLVVCSSRSCGGVGKFSEYSLNLAILFGAQNPASGAGLTPHLVRGSCDQNPASGAGFEMSPLFIRGTSTLINNVADGSKCGVVDSAEFRRLAEWMFTLLIKLNPKLRAPSWSGWCRDIRFMVERDKHTLREIAELFKFANDHAFWQSNIESPGKLRKQWNRLLLERGKGGGQDAIPQIIDTTCQGEKADGSRCGSVNTTGDSPSGAGPYFCWECRTAMDRAKALRRPTMAASMR